MSGWRSLELGASIPAAIVVIVVTFLTLAYSLIGFRVQYVTWLFLALLLAALPRSRSRWLLLPLTLLWANLHASAVLAPVLIAVYALGRGADHPGERAQLASITVLCALATCATPLGLAVPEYAISTLGASAATAFTTEFQTPPAVLISGAIAVALAAAFAPRDRVGSGERLIIVVLFLMMIGSARQSALFFLGAGPFAAAAVRLRSYALVASGPLAAAFGALAAGVALIVVLVAAPSIGPHLRPLPESAAAYIEQQPHARLFCADFAWCGLVVGSPGVRVFLDGRADPFPRRVWIDNQAILGDPDWAAILARNALNLVLVAKEGHLARELSASNAWVLGYADGNYEVFRARSRAAAPSIRPG